MDWSSWALLSLAPLALAGFVASRQLRSEMRRRRVVLLVGGQLLIRLVPVPFGVALALTGSPTYARVIGVLVAVLCLAVAIPFAVTLWATMYRWPLVLEAAHE